MTLTKLAFLTLTLSLLGCASGPTVDTDPDAEAFAAEDLSVWQRGQDSVPTGLVGLWRSVELSAGENTTPYACYRFGLEGAFSRDDGRAIADPERRPLTEGAYRVDGAHIICHIQILEGRIDWRATREGKGQVASFGFKVLDAETLLLSGQTPQNLTVRYKRVE
jgi:hypothetical protein